MELRFIAVRLILILGLSGFARAQVANCLPLSETDLGTANAPSTTGLVGAAFQAVSGEPSMHMPVSVQVHASNIVCLSSGLIRNTYRGVSVVVNYTCTGAPSECTGNPTLSQFEFECVANPVRWAASVDGSASNIITTPPDGSLSTTPRTDCIVCISPARPTFATITNNEQHCGFVDCGIPLDPPNGIVNISRVTAFNQVATYSCNSGHILVGTRTRTCQADGRWSGGEPICESLCFPQCVNGTCVNGTCRCPVGHSGQGCSVVDCGALTNPDNGSVATPQGTTFNQVATYSCNCGYCPVGDETRICQANGEWSGSEPTCGNSLSTPADTEILTYSTYTYLNDIATIAAIAIAMISLLTSVVIIAIMVCFVIYFQKRFSAVTERWNQHMDKQQNVAHATKAVIDPEKQEKFYGTEV